MFSTNKIQTFQNGFTLPLIQIQHQGLPVQNLILGDEEPLINVAQSSYLIESVIGNQTFQVTFDTGSSDLWVVSSNCTTSDCAGVAKYSLSSDLNLTSSPFDLNYLSGSASGFIAYENISLGEFVNPTQVFGLVDNTESLGLSDIGNSGVLGLAFPTEASISQSLGNTLLQNIFSSLDPSNQFFGYSLSRESQGSTFSIGQLDSSVSSRSSEIITFPVYPASTSGNYTYDFWKIPFLSINVGDDTLNLTTSKISSSDSAIAVFDTGTTLILGPTSEVKAFWNLIGDASLGLDGLWRVTCDRILDVSFVLGNSTLNSTFTIDPSDVVWLDAGGIDGQCLGGIQSNDGVVSGDWLLGASFLRNVYVTNRAATSASPPLIGLLSLTEPYSSSGSQNQAKRFVGNNFSKSSSGVRIYVLFFFSSFLGSAALTMAWKAFRAAKKSKNFMNDDTKRIHNYTYIPV